MQEERLPFSGFSSIFSPFDEGFRGDRDIYSAFPVRRAQSAGIHFQKIYPYYIISIRQNQLFFATFSSKIANSSLCTNNSCAISGILGISDNSIFPNGFNPALFCKNTAFSLLSPPTDKRRLYSLEPSGAGEGIIFAFSHPLRLQPCRLHPAFCSFPKVILHVFPRIRRKGHSFPRLPGTYRCLSRKSFSSGKPPRSIPSRSLPFRFRRL